MLEHRGPSSPSSVDPGGRSQNPKHTTKHGYPN